MLVACAWVTLAASIVPKTLPQPTRPAVSHRGAASSMFLPLTGARQSSSAELSSSQKQLSQQLAHSASGSTLSLNLNGCASHRACTRVLHTQRLPLRTLPLYAQQLSALCTLLLALGAPHAALRSPHVAPCALLSALCALRSAHAARRKPHAARRTLRRTPRAARRTPLRLRARSALSALCSPHTPQAARCTPHAARYAARRTLHAARYTPHATRRTPHATGCAHRLHATGCAP